MAACDPRTGPSRSGSRRSPLQAPLADPAPECHPEKWPTEEAQNAERERLFDIIRKMMGKKMHEHPEVYAEALTEMLRHTPENVGHFLLGNGEEPLPEIA